MARNSSFVRLRIDGLAEVRRVLEQVPPELRDKVMRVAVGRAAGPLVSAIKLHAGRSVRTGALRESIGAVVRRSKGGTGVYAVVGPRRGYYRGGKAVAKVGAARGADQPANYAHLVEYGHHAVARKVGTSLRKGTATVVGFVPAKPFMRPALASAGEAVLTELARGVEDGIARQLRRLVKNPKAVR
jgi:hypothetical protein